MSNGVLCFANNNGKINYIKQAVFLAKRIKRHLDVPTSIVTSTPNLINKTDRKFFDKIIEIDDPKEAANGSHCIVTDTWFSMGDKEDSSKRDVLSQFQVTNELISLADDNVIFLHCLPAHRGEEVDSQVIDGPHSFVWDEAENRLHAQKGIIDWCLNSN